MTTQTTLAPYGHSLIVLDAPITTEADAQAWREHLDFVSGTLEQNDALLIVPFTDLTTAKAFAEFNAVKTSYRFVAVLYNGATGSEPALSASIAATIASEADPALPFNELELPLPVVAQEHKLTATDIEQALQAGVSVVALNESDKPAIVRLITTYRTNPTTGLADDIALDVNAPLILRYVRRDLRAAAKANPRRKNTAAARKNLRSLFLSRCLKLDDAEILQNVRERQNELTVTQDSVDKTKANASVPSVWVRGMHIIDTTLNVY